MNDTELNTKLALAIGWSQSDILIEDGEVYVTDERWYNVGGHRRFDYRDPTVIWEIAKRYDVFPRKNVTHAIQKYVNPDWEIYVADGPCTYAVKAKSPEECVVKWAIENAADREDTLRQDDMIKQILKDFGNRLPKIDQQYKPGLITDPVFRKR